MVGICGWLSQKSPFRLKSGLKNNCSRRYANHLLRLAWSLSWPQKITHVSDKSFSSEKIVLFSQSFCCQNKCWPEIIHLPGPPLRNNKYFLPVLRSLIRRCYKVIYLYVILRIDTIYDDSSCIHYLDMTLFSLNIVILRGLTFSQILIGFNKFKSYSHDEISREFSILPGVSLWYVSVCLGCLYGMSVCAKGACTV